MNETLNILLEKVKSLSIEKKESDELFKLIKKIDKHFAKSEFKVSSIINTNVKTKQLLNSMLEEINDKNKEIVNINEDLIVSEEELKQQNEELLTLNEQIEKQKEEIRKIHKNITDSIQYAKTIQQALLSSKEIIDNSVDEYFIFYKAKELVSGDFYYFNKVDKNIIIAVADCTGHGVPGGFLTMLGTTYLHEIIRRDHPDNPGEALNLLRKRFKETFQEFGSNNSNGLDIALCSINTETNTLQYAGAYNPLIIIRNNELIEYKATRNPIGFYPKEKDFKNHKIQLFENDVIYIFTDGFQDQLGEKSHRKYKSDAFKKLLLDIHKLPMNVQQDKLSQIFIDWKGKNKQTDDILIFGTRYNITK